MVSVFDGQLTRTWIFPFEKSPGIKRNHIINLYHDTITGVRSVMLDFQEIPGSVGNSSLVMESKGHRIFFTIENLPGFVEIKKSGWTGFSYSCVINTEVINEMTQTVAQHQQEVFKTSILDTAFTQDEFAEQQVAWYIVKATRIQDGVSTIVHRRFRDFAELNSQVKQNMKGHHLRWSLPPLPEKPLKSMTDHNDPSFIQDRYYFMPSEIPIIILVTIPHVPEMICLKAFLGIMDQLGLSLVQSSRPGDTSTPAIVGQVHKPETCTGVMVGDSISKINGVPVTGFNFNGVVARIKTLPRPIIVHFIQIIGSSAGSPAKKTFFDEDSSSLTESNPQPYVATTPSSTSFLSAQKPRAHEHEEDGDEDDAANEETFISVESQPSSASRPNAKPNSTFEQPLGWD
eukprot:gene25339-33873_t